MIKIFLFSCVSLLAPLTAFGHEVYVLPQDTIQQAISAERFSVLDVIVKNIDQFELWAIIFSIGIIIIFFISISPKLERRCNTFLAKLPPYAPVIGRVTIGLSFMLGSYNNALFGPELPLHSIFGGFANVVSILLIIIGGMIIVGYKARIAALVAFLLFTIEIFYNGIYMLTYANYMGEIILLLILGSHKWAIHNIDHDIKNGHPYLLWLKEKLTPYSFLILRVLFGVSLIYASVYAKIIHNQLAFSVTTAYPAVQVFFGFEPHFLVVATAVVEILIGLFFILGIEIRFTSLFLLFWLALSLSYFGEAVWPHVVLIGIPIAFIFYGYDKYSLEGFFFKHDNCEPVL